MNIHRKSRRKSGVRALLAVVMAALAALVATPLNAAPTADFATMLPEDTAAVVRVTGLSAYWEKLADSPLRKKIEFAPLPEVAELFADVTAALEHQEQEVGINIKDTFSAIFGHDFLIALLPDGKAVFLGRNPDAEDLKLAVDNIIAMEKKENKIQDDKFEAYNGTEIRSMMVAEGMAPAKQRHHALTGNILIVSRSLDAVKSTLTLMAKDAGMLASSRKYQAALKRAQPGAIVTIYLY